MKHLLLIITIVSLVLLGVMGPLNHYRIDWQWAFLVLAAGVAIATRDAIIEREAQEEAANAK